MKIRGYLKKTVPPYDWFLILSVLALIAFGLLMLSSASIVISDQKFSCPFHYLFHQSAFAMFSLGLAVSVFRIRMEFWERNSRYLLLLGFFLLVSVLIPGIGRVVNGSRRWISFGLISVEVSEVVKLCFIIYLGRYIHHFELQVREKFKGFLKPVVLLSFIGILLLLEPDFGSFAVLSMTVLMMLFLAGVRLLPFLLLFLFMVLTMVSLAVLSPYRLERLTAFLNPWSHAFGSGYQLTQSLIAFGRGGFFGVGLGNSIQKIYYLPEAYTDFIFAVVAEELGILGELLLITLFFFIVYRIFKIGLRAHNQNSSPFNAFICYGSGLWIGLQTLVNIGVNVGVLPTKGLTLPFVSYGGSSLFINCILISIVLRIAYETSEAHW